MDPPPPARDFTVALVQELVDAKGLLLEQGVVSTIVAALKSGKHIILTGPPGTAKTTLAQLLGEAAHLAGRCAGSRLTTATSDWTTFETVGGLHPSKDDGSLVFEPGQFLSAIIANEWLVIDELNRSNFDRAFGQLFTVLAGQSVELPYQDSRTGHPIEICLEGAPSATTTGKARVEVPDTWRMIATMNVFDKSLLFEMSFALMRRFCFVEVAAPAEEHYVTLIRRESDGDDALADVLEETIAPLLSLRSLKELGPALFIDVAKFCRERIAIGAVAPRALRFQLFYSYLLPQFEGISDLEGRALFKRLSPMISASDVERLRQTLHDVLGVQIARGLGAEQDKHDETAADEEPDYETI